MLQDVRGRPFRLRMPFHLLVAHSIDGVIKGLECALQLWRQILFRHAANFMTFCSSSTDLDVAAVATGRSNDSLTALADICAFSQEIRGLSVEDPGVPWADCLVLSAGFCQ